LVDGCGGVTFAGCFITNNSTAYGRGQGMSAVGVTLTMTNSRVADCFSSASGGGGKQGGGLHLNDVDGVIGASVIGGNSMWPSAGTTGSGGGLYLDSGELTLRNCLVVTNEGATGGSVTGYGDGLYLFRGRLQVENCTIADNLGEGVRREGGAMSVTNSILWSNGDDVVGTVALGYNDIEDGDGAGAAGGISADPLFTDAGAGDYTPDRLSPCINAGTNLSWVVTAVDLAGAPRVENKIVDMGAYETLIPAGGTVIVIR
jgi:hypothetical protein